MSEVGENYLNISETNVKDTVDTDVVMDSKMEAWLVSSLTGRSSSESCGIWKIFKALLLAMGMDKLKELP